VVTDPLYLDEPFMELEFRHTPDQQPRVETGEHRRRGGRAKPDTFRTICRGRTKALKEFCVSAWACRSRRLGRQGHDLPGIPADVEGADGQLGYEARGIDRRGLPAPTPREYAAWADISDIFGVL
jgi:hypothetical protein